MVTYSMTGNPGEVLLITKCRIHVLNTFLKRDIQYYICSCSKFLNLQNLEFVQEGHTSPAQQPR